MNIILRTLEKKDEASFFEGLKDWEDDLDWYTFDWNQKISFDELLLILKDKSEGKNLPNDMVPSTMFYGFCSNKIVGRLHLRHKLNDSLSRYGGHIGYAVAKKFRQHGYASEMMNQALPICKNMGLSKILLTCANDNVPSYKIIEKAGGELECKIWDQNHLRWTRRYWIKL